MAIIIVYIVCDSISKERRILWKSKKHVMTSGQMRADFDLRSAAVGTTKTIATFTLNNIPHNANGTCTINVSGTHATGLTSSTAGNWGTKSIGNTAITLDTIPRYATCNISLDSEFTDDKKKKSKEEK